MRWYIVTLVLSIEVQKEKIASFRPSRESSRAWSRPHTCMGETYPALAAGTWQRRGHPATIVPQPGPSAAHRRPPSGTAPPRHRSAHARRGSAPGLARARPAGPLESLPTLQTQHRAQLHSAPAGHAMAVGELTGERSLAARGPAPGPTTSGRGLPDWRPFRRGAPAHGRIGGRAAAWWPACGRSRGGGGFRACVSGAGGQSHGAASRRTRALGAQPS